MLNSWVGLNQMETISKVLVEAVNFHPLPSEMETHLLTTQPHDAVYSSLNFYNGKPLIKVYKFMYPKADFFRYCLLKS